MLTFDRQGNTKAQVLMGQKMLPLKEIRTLS